jgi:hypothetical protein
MKIVLSVGPRSIIRSCTHAPMTKNGTIEIAGVKTSYSSCQRDGCNAANSLSSGTSMAITMLRILRPKCRLSLLSRNFIGTLIKLIEMKLTVIKKTWSGIFLAKGHFHLVVVVFLF